MILQKENKIEYKLKATFSLSPPSPLVSCQVMEGGVSEKTQQWSSPQMAYDVLCRMLGNVTFTEMKIEYIH